MNRKSFGIILSLVTAAVFVGAGCSLKFSTVKYKDDQQNAIAGTKKLHDMFNDGMYDAIYEMADDRAKQTKSKDALIAVFTRLQSERGRILDADLTDAKVEPRAAYREVHLTFHTRFENGESKEDIVWYVSSEKAAFFTLSFE